jgi:hypothetical protein
VVITATTVAINHRIHLSNRSAEKDWHAVFCTGKMDAEQRIARKKWR